MVVNQEVTSHETGQDEGEDRPDSPYGPGPDQPVGGLVRWGLGRAAGGRDPLHHPPLTRVSRRDRGNPARKNRSTVPAAVAVRATTMGQGASP